MHYYATTIIDQCYENHFEICFDMDDTNVWTD
jgi:hypothetical protein